MLVVDFDVSESFVIQGNPQTPAGIHGMLFKPTLRVVVMDVAGTISGTVTTELATARVDSLLVEGEPVDEGLVEQYQTETVMTRTRGDGTYTLWFVPPGEYTVRVTPADTMLRAEPDSIRVTVGLGEDVDSVDFEIDSIP
jgi:(2Fe-2S) ferredoxin